MNKCNAPWHERGMSVSSAANSARSVHLSFGRAAVDWLVAVVLAIEIIAGAGFHH